MEYKKIQKENYTLHLINTNRFKTINIVVFMTTKFNKDDIVYNTLLSQNLVYTSKKYNTKNKMAIRGEELFGSKVSTSFGIVGNMEELVFSTDFLNPKYTEDKYMEESIDFLSEIIFNPNVENSKFNEEYFNIIRNDNIARVNSIKDNPGLYASTQYAKIMYEGTPTAYDTFSTIEEINKVTPSSLYEYYKNLFTDKYNVQIVVLGEIDDSLLKVLDNKFKQIHSNNKKYNFMINHKYDIKPKEKIDSLPFNQSKLYMGYRLNDLTYHEQNHVLKVYNTILGTMNDSVLFNIVREQNSLCYSVGSYTSKYNPSLTIYAGINKVNYEKTIALIKECVNNMSNKKDIERLFDSAKKTINTYLNNYYDDVTAQVNHYYSCEFEEDEDVETLRENINNVTIDEVCELNKKISLSVIYLLKGDN